MVPGAGAGVDDPHTERKVSKRSFSTCRRSRPTPEAKHATRTRADLCSRVPLDCTPAITIDLADAHEHDERAELDQEHHDEADHNAQAPSPASSKHWSLWSTLLFRTHLQHAAGVRRTHDQQMQQRGGRRRSVTQHGRVHEPAQPPARAARATRPSRESAIAHLILSIPSRVPSHI